MDHVRSMRLMAGLSSLALLLGGVTLAAQVTWDRYQANPVIGSSFDQNADLLFRPSVIFDGTTYHMWYGKANVEGDGDEQMGYATSPDGLNWILESETILSHSDDPEAFDYVDASQGWVISDNDTLKMWYWGNGLDIGNIGYAWSLDGVNWTKVKGNGTDGSVYDKNMDNSEAISLATPCVVRKDDLYHLWYSRALIEGGALIYRIGYATSSDGINWINNPGQGAGGAVLAEGEEGRFDEAAVAWPSVIATDEGFMMWYAGVDSLGVIRTGYATSSDGIDWVRVTGTGTGGAVFDEPDFPCVLKADDGYKMWYGINAEKTISYATSGIPLSVETHEHALLLTLDNYPNPFRERTTIAFTLPASSHVSIALYNLLGAKEAEIASGYYSAGEQRVEWEANDLPEGIYIYELTTPESTIRKRLNLIR